MILPIMKENFAKFKGGDCILTVCARRVFREYTHLLFTEDELAKYVVKCKLNGAQRILIEGGELAAYTVEMNNIVKGLSQVLPIRLSTDGFRISEVEKIVWYLNGICLRLKVPIKDSYNAADKERYMRILGSERWIYTYVKYVKQITPLMTPLSDSCFRIVYHKLLTPEEFKMMVDYSKRAMCKYSVIDRRGESDE